MVQPKISILTVSYNSEKYIEEAIKSVINQSYENKEYLIIDGASTDGTMDIVRNYADKIDVIISEPDKGISDAFNKGIKKATGDVVCIVNSDDIMPDGALALFAEQYEEGIDVFRGQEIIRNFENGSQYVMTPTLKYSKLPFFFNVCHMATYIRRDAFERFGYYDEEFRCSMDRELLFRFHRMGATEKRIEGIFGIFRLGGISQNIGKRKTEEAKEVIRRNGGSALHVFVFGVYVNSRTIAKKVITKLKKR